MKRLNGKEYFNFINGLNDIIIKYDIERKNLTNSKPILTINRELIAEATNYVHEKLELPTEYFDVIIQNKNDKYELKIVDWNLKEITAINILNRKYNILDCSDDINTILLEQICAEIDTYNQLCLNNTGITNFLTQNYINLENIIEEKIDSLIDKIYNMYGSDIIESVGYLLYNYNKDHSLKSVSAAESSYNDDYDIFESFYDKLEEKINNHISSIKINEDKKI